MNCGGLDSIFFFHPIPEFFFCSFPEWWLFEHSDLYIHHMYWYVGIIWVEERWPKYSAIFIFTEDSYSLISSSTLYFYLNVFWGTIRNNLDIIIPIISLFCSSNSKVSFRVLLLLITHGWEYYRTCRSDTCEIGTEWFAIYACCGSNANIFQYFSSLCILTDSSIIPCSIWKILIRENGIFWNYKSFIVSSLFSIIFRKCEYEIISVNFPIYNWI